MRARILVFPVLAIGLSAVLAIEPAWGQRRDTICLHIASESVCTDLAVKKNSIERRIMQRDDIEMERVCRDILAEQFGRLCAQRFLKATAEDRDCYYLFKRMERTYKRQFLTHRFARTDTRDCS